MIRYQAKLTREDDGYSVDFPDLPGCFSMGDTRDEAIEHAAEALSLYLESARDPKWEVPKAKSRKGKSYVWVTPDESVAIPLAIRQARLAQGIGQRELAKRLGKSVSQIQKLEMPGANPTVKTLRAISDALDLSLEINLAA